MLFLNMRNKPISETELIKTAVEQLRRELPAGWELGLQRTGADRRASAGPVLELRAGRARAALEVDAKLQLEPGTLRRFLAARSSRARQSLLVTSYVGKTAKSLLAESGVNYIDATGNVRITIESPALLLKLDGAAKQPWRDTRPLRSLKGPIAGRVVRGLCDFMPSFGTRELAQRLGISAAMVSRVVDILDRDGLIERDARGPIRDVDWERLLRRWADDYSFARSNRMRPALALRGLAAVMDRLKSIPTPYALSGSIAAQAMGPIAPSRLAMIYTTDIATLTSELDLETVDATANVLLAEPFDGIVFDRTRTVDGLVHAAPPQVAADLLTGPGRSPQEAEAVIAWMKANESAWRT